MPDPIRVFGFCGLTASISTFSFGVYHQPWMMALSGGLMVAANVYALTYRRGHG